MIKLVKRILLKQKIKSKTQEIEKALPEEFQETFRNSCFLAGGAVRDLLIGKKPKDWDIFFNLGNSCIDNFLKDLGKTYGYPNMIIQFKSDNALSVLINGQQVQFIGKKYAGHPDYVINRFDFTNSMGYYDIGTDKLVITPEMEKACENKTLQFNEDAFSPKLSPKRAKKFTDNGWDYDEDYRWDEFQECTGYTRLSMVNFIYTAPKKGTADDGNDYD